MDLTKLSSNYISRLLNTSKDSKDSKNSNNNAFLQPNIKVLLLDKYTTPIISMISTQSELLQHEVYLIDRLDNFGRDKMRHLSCICFLKPDEESINYLITELQSPKYFQYELYFNNILSKNQLERLAEKDDFEVVVKVQEIFEDYLVVNKDLFAINNVDHTPIYASLDSWNKSYLNTAVNSLTALLLSLEQKPVIRYEKNSAMAETLANNLNSKIKENSNNQLFDTFAIKDVPPLLLILDRKNDPITPLLTPWTFQSMVHELIGISNNTVDLSYMPNISKELSKIVLSPDQDSFYKESMYLNFGDLSDKIKDYVEKYKVKTKSTAKLDSIQDMKQFVESYPEFRKLSNNVSKHMSLASELDRNITQQRLWEVSELEQSLSCSNNHSSDLEDLEKLLNNLSTNDALTEEQQKLLPPISQEAKIRLVVLYALRYESNPSNQLSKLLNILKSQGISDSKIKLIQFIVRFYGKTKRLDNEENLFNKATSTLIAGFKTSHENDNIFMQHIPRLEAIISKAVRGKLPASMFPILSSNNDYALNPNEKSQDIIIYMVGGTTYEESRIVHNLNLNNKNCRLILGGDKILNTHDFFNDLYTNFEKYEKNKSGIDRNDLSIEERLQSRLDDLT
ncbi:hypothetical protein PACTADRAFT_66277 [Pachysolen tannophilus NRRL Y-2460]|uniref:Vacuolar protein sorting-associated protein 45 n=1 Tax=Pachysolen tannophilus NRRL Y-2460 TaxID=669874 RepID=A0A1E4U067_PACTA|nr:hypothetical protein PACTADRAFT_66277 [Pachysolen tannophilus NRRL Y-2460]